MRQTVALLIVLISPLILMLSACTAAPSYEGPSSEHFDGTRFSNREPMEKSPADFIRLAWGALTESADWPPWRETSEETSPATRVNDGLSITFINHASFLIQVDGYNILTDPIYSERASPFQWAGPKRVNAPGVALESLPHIDAVLISHNHYDHLDADTLVALSSQQETPPLIVAGLGNGLLFEQLGLQNYLDLDWQQSTKLGSLEIVFTECRHRSGRGISDQMKTLWGSFVIKTSAGPIYFAGDTGYSPHLQEAGEEYGPFRLALLPIGAYEPRWFMADVHMNPEEAVRAHLDLRSEHSIGMHFGTFQLTYEGIDVPQEALAMARDKHGVLPSQFEVPEVGQTIRFDSPNVMARTP